MKKHMIILFLIAVLLVSLTACRSVESVGQQKETEQTEKRSLTAEEAQSIALNHAGVERADAKFDRSEYDTDDGVPEYEIEFHADGWEYDYEIHAKTGDIRSSNKEKERDRSTADTDPVPMEPAVNTEPGLTAEQAEEIALTHAGVKRSDARFVRTEYDTDDGVPEYEIEFRADGWEYDYEIQAETGAILSSQKERDD